MWRFVMTHQKEGTIWITVLKPLQRFFSNNISYIARFCCAFTHFNHFWVEIVALSGQYRPKVKACWLVIVALSQMPFAYHRSLITTDLQMFGNIWQPIIEMCFQSSHAIYMIIGACQNCCSTRCANGISYVTMIQTNAFVTDTINVWRCVYF